MLCSPKRLRGVLAASALAAVAHAECGCLQCPRVDGRTISEQDAASVTVPTILTHVLDGLADDAWDEWERSELLHRHGNTTFSKVGPVFKHPFLWQIIDGRESVTLAEALDMNASIEGPFFVPGIYPLARRLLQAAESGDMPVNRLLQGQGELGYVSLTARGQFAPIHMHNHAFVTQVKGSKGWMLAPPEAFKEHLAQKQVFLDFSDPGRPLWSGFGPDRGAPDDGDARLNNAEQICGLFDETCPAEGGLASVPGLYCCRLNAGESLVYPGKDFWHGWWHGTCGLEDWNAAFSHFEWDSPEACRLYFENDAEEAVEVLWHDPDGEPLPFSSLAPGHWTTPINSWFGVAWSLRGVLSGARSETVTCGGEKPRFWRLDKGFSLSLRPEGPSA